MAESETALNIRIAMRFAFWAFQKIKIRTFFVPGLVSSLPRMRETLRRIAGGSIGCGGKVETLRIFYTIIENGMETIGDQGIA